MICEVCGKEFDNEDLLEFDGHITCKECFDNDFINDYAYCKVCGEIFKIDDMQEIDDELYCNECVDDNFVRCYECGEYFHINDVKEYGGDYYCEDCFDENFIECYECGETIRIEDAYEHNGDYYCGNCWDDNFTTCYQCGETIRIEDAYEYDDEYYCRGCYEEIKHDYINCYHCGDNAIKYTKLHAYNESVDDKTAYFGIEVETEGGYDNAEIVNDMLDNLTTMEEDGSLDEGFEIISSPMTYKRWLQEYQRFNKCFTKLRENGQRSHDTTTCGLHIHISRKAFNNETSIDKFVALINRFQSEFENIGRRSGNSYARFNTIKPYVSKNDIYTFKNATRYLAVNCSNSKTIEVRLFRGTLNFSTIMASIEILKNCLEVVNNEHKLNVKFRDIAKGYFLETYIHSLTKNGKTFNFNKSIDFASWFIEDTKKMLKETKLIKDMLKETNNLRLTRGLTPLVA